VGRGVGEYGTDQYNDEKQIEVGWREENKQEVIWGISEVPPLLPELVCPKPSSVALNPWGQGPMPWRRNKEFSKVVIFIKPTYLEASC